MYNLTRLISNRGHALRTQLGLLVALPALAIPLLFQSVTVADAAPALPSTYVKSNTVDLSVTAGSADVSCNSGDFATGGGFDFSGGAKTARQSEPNVSSGKPTGWHAFFGVGIPGMATVFVVCMTPVTVGTVTTSTSVIEKDKTFSAPDFTAGGATASCAGSDFATGGGFETAGGRNVLRSLPDPMTGMPNGWRSFFSVQFDPFETDTVKSFAVCMTPVTAAGAATSTSVASGSMSVGNGAGGASANCVAGDFASGGGFDFVPAGKFILMSQPSPTNGMPPTGWSTFYGIGGSGTETAFAICLRVPNVPPSLTVSAKTATDGKDYPGAIWTNQDVIVTFTCSGVGVPSIPPVTVSSEGKGSVTRTCTDSSGASATATFANIWIDKTAPVTTASVTGPAGTNGWFKAGSPVLLTLSASDNLSGVATSNYSVNGGATQVYSGPVPFGDSALWTVTYWSTDNAGNVEASHSTSFKVDQTAPTISAAATLPDGSSYSAGSWTNQAVTVTFTCNDLPLGVASGVASVTSPVTLTADGADQAVTGTCIDLAGNRSSVRFQHINISTVTPTITVTLTLTGTAVVYPPATWSNHDVTVTFACTTGPSGLKSLVPTTVVVTIEDKNPTIPGICTDNAGNSATIDSGAIWIDKTAPLITYSGQQAIYLLTDMINIDCTATDPLPPLGGQNSGVNPATDTCSGPLGSNLHELASLTCPTGCASYCLSSEAFDYALNKGTGSVCFTVSASASYSGLVKLTRLYVTNREVAARLVRELNAAQRAEQRGNLCAAQAHLVAYRRTVQKQIGRSITAAHAATLIQLSKFLGVNPTNCGNGHDGDHGGGDQRGNGGGQNRDRHHRGR